MKANLLFSPPVFLLLMMPYSSQAQQVTFNQVFPPDNPYFRMINGVTQDTLGYMWFSSYGIGLTRYDGYHVTIFRNDRRDPGFISFDGVACVLAAHSGFIWTGTVDSGLDRLDPRTGIFTHFRHKKEEPLSLSDDAVTAILEDHDGAIWVGTAEWPEPDGYEDGNFYPLSAKPNRYDQPELQPRAGNV
jgi:ligand-binding sensor domain-containing protein